MSEQIGTDEMNGLSWNDSQHDAETSMRDGVEELHLNDESTATEKIDLQPERENEIVPQPESKVLYLYLYIYLCNHATLVIFLILIKPMLNKTGN